MFSCWLIPQSSVYVLPVAADRINPAKGANFCTCKADSNIYLKSGHLLRPCSKGQSDSILEISGSLP